MKGGDGRGENDWMIAIYRTSSIVARVCQCAALVLASSQRAINNPSCEYRHPLVMAKLERGNNFLTHFPSDLRRL
jgi:hypothetical protein